MDFINEEFEAFKSSVNRMRWFIITSVVISALILIHTYIEQFSFQEHQLASIYGHRLDVKTSDLQNCRKEFIKAHDLKIAPPDKCSNVSEKILEQIKTGNIEDLRKKYSTLKFEIKRTNNTLRNTELGKRQMPLLGIEVPTNDFLNVMSLMSTVIVVGVWVNLLGVHASLNALKKHNEPKIIELARLNTLFLTHLETESGQLLAKIVRLIVIWLPFISILTSVFISIMMIVIEKYVNNEESSFYGTLGYVLFNVIFISLVIGVHFWIAFECRYLIKDINSFFDTKS